LATQVVVATEIDARKGDQRPRRPSVGNCSWHVKAKERGPREAPEGKASPGVGGNLDRLSAGVFWPRADRRLRSSLHVCCVR
jgi:hypothetical protein